MAKEQNPFSSFLDSWAADPEAEAKGRVYSETGRLRGEEANRMASINAARNAFLNDPTIAHSVKMAALGREQMDAKNTMEAVGAYHANQVLAPTDRFGNTTYATPTPAKLTLASALQGNAYHPQAPQQAQIHDANGITTQVVTDANGIASLRPLVNSVETVNNATYAGGQSQNVTKHMDKNGNIVAEVTQTPISGAVNLSTADLAAAMKARSQSSAVGLGSAATGYAGGKYSYLLGRHLGYLDNNGKATDLPALNPIEDAAFSARANEYESAGYTPQEAFKATLDEFPQIRDGQTGTRKFNNTWYTPTWGNNNFVGANPEVDAKGAILPQFGHDYVTTNNFDQKNPSTVKPGNKIVPFGTNVSSAQDRNTISSVVAGGYVKPELASPSPNSGLFELGKFYHNDGKFYVGRLGKDGKVVLEEITGKNQ